MCNFNMRCSVSAQDLKMVEISFSGIHDFPTLSDLSLVKHNYSPLYCEKVRQYYEISPHMTAFDMYKAVVKYLTDAFIPPFYFPTLKSVTEFLKTIKRPVKGYDCYQRGSFLKLEKYAVKKLIS